MEVPHLPLLYIWNKPELSRLSWAYFQLLQPQQPFAGLKVLGCSHLAQTQSAGQWGSDLVTGRLQTMQSCSLHSGLNWLS